MTLRVLPARAELLPPDDRRRLPASWRCSVVVSGKVSKRAVHRNRIRRLLQSHLLRLPPRPAAPQWLLLSLKPAAANAEASMLLEECSNLLRKAGLLP